MRFEIFGIPCMYGRIVLAESGQFLQNGRSCQRFVLTPVSGSINSLPNCPNSHVAIMAPFLSEYIFISIISIIKVFIYF